MAKYYGKIGFATHTEAADRPGVWLDDIVVEREYYGDVVQSSRSWSNGQSLNDDFSINVRISVIADDFASQNLPNVRYAYWRGNRFKVVSADDSQYPRLVLTLGGEYNG